jgi:outer membrane protein
VPGEDSATEVLLERALEANPEVSALGARIDAAEKTLAATGGGYWPVFDAATSLNERGAAPDDLVWNWQGALRLTWPLYQGGLTTAQESAARHELTGLRAQADGLRQQLRLRVEEARLGVRAGKAAEAASEEALRAARERLRLAEGRYETGLGNAIELSDAQLALTNAQAQKVRALQALTAARAKLLLVLGDTR